MAARAEPCASANPPTAAAEAVTKKPRRDRLEVVAVTFSSMSRFAFDCFGMPISLNRMPNSKHRMQGPPAGQKSQAIAMGIVRPAKKLGGTFFTRHRARGELCSTTVYYRNLGG